MTARHPNIHWSSQLLPQARNLCTCQRKIMGCLPKSFHILTGSYKKRETRGGAEEAESFQRTVKSLSEPCKPFGWCAEPMQAKSRASFNTKAPVVRYGTILLMARPKLSASKKRCEYRPSLVHPCIACYSLGNSARDTWLRKEIQSEQGNDTHLTNVFNFCQASLARMSPNPLQKHLILLHLQEA